MTTECYHGVTINKTIYPYDSRYSIWTTGVGGSGTQGFGSMFACKSYIDTLYNIGSRYSQCVPPIEPPVIPPTPKTDMEYTKYIIAILVIIILYYSFRK